MKVIATARGFDNITVREIGDEFDMPKDAKGSWFKPVAEAKGKKPAEQGEKPAEPAAGDLA